MSKKMLVLIAAGAAIVATAAIASPADAQTRGRSVVVQGANGHGYARNRSIARQPGAVSAERSLQTNSGRGITSSRSATWGGGVYSGGASHTLNNGSTFGRSTTIVDNGDGTYSYSTNRTGPNGGVASGSGTVSRPE